MEATQTQSESTDGRSQVTEMSPLSIPPVLTLPDLQCHSLTGAAALELLRSGKLTVTAYANALLSWIRKRDYLAAEQDRILAWAYLDPRLILSNAAALDSIPLDKCGPLHGLPVAVKDNILTADMPTRYNSPLYQVEATGKDPLALKSGIDAAIVMILRQAGALILGKTTTTEFAATPSSNAVQNFTRNPSVPAGQPHRTPGGSSSGSAAAVADHQVPVALGTQTGGSVIRPASFCGVYGFKPTWGAVSREGAAFYSVTCDTVGWFGRCSEDLELLAKVLGAYDESDDGQIAGGWDVRGKKIGFCRTHVWTRDNKAGNGLEKVWNEAKEMLLIAGANVEELELPDEFAHISKWHSLVLAGEGRSAFLGHYSWDKTRLGDSMRDQVENKGEISRKALLEAQDGCAKLRPVWDGIAAQFDAIITPSVPDEAPQGLDWTGDACFCSTWTILHAPAVNVPGLVGENGLPVGLTLVGSRYDDRNVLKAAKAIGKLFENGQNSDIETR